MKKILTFILAFSMVLGMSLNTLAATDMTGNGTASSDITKSVTSEFSVLIPKMIEMGEATNVEFEVQAKGNIAPTEELAVTVEETVDMKRVGDAEYDNLDASVTLTDCSWNYETLASEYGSKSGSITFEEAKAGEYYGTGTFYIALQQLD